MLLTGGGLLGAGHRRQLLHPAQDARLEVERAVDGGRLNMLYVC